ncbi:MAG: MarR family transcriptional regulator [Alphaproteobacteria bacterium]
MAEPISLQETSDLDDEAVRDAIEMLFLATSALVADADRDLAREGMGHAHLRALYLIGRHPGLTVSDLLSLLDVTKQSLSRVLADLIARQHVTQVTGITDRRRRHLHLTPAGQALEARLTERQRQRMARAFATCGAPAVGEFGKVAQALLDSGMRAWFARRDIPG